MQTTITEIGVIEYAQQILDIIKDADSFTASKVLECAKTLHEYHVYVREFGQRT